jgi:hypothetical protein
MNTWHYFAIWIAGWLFIAFINGYADGDKKKMDEAAGIIGAFWPVLAIMAVLASPIWLPMAFSGFGRYVRQREEQKEAVKRALSPIRKSETT